MIGVRRIATVVAAAAVVASGACGAPGSAIDPAQHLASFHTTLRVQPSGAIDVTEDLVLASAAPGAPLVRRIPVDLFDRIDRIAWSAGGGATQPLTSADPSGGLDVAIPAAAASTGGPIELTYRVAGAIAVRGARGLLTWDVLPNGHPFAIDEASIVLVLPDTMPAVSTPRAPASGWTMASTPDGWRFEAHGVPARAPVTLTTELAIDANAVVEPEWQALETRTRQLMPAFVSAAFFILVTGAGALWMIRWQVSIKAPEGAARDLDPAAIARGLVLSGWFLIVSGLIGAAVTWRWFTFFGAWPVVVPLSLTVVGLVFLPEAARVRARADRRT